MIETVFQSQDLQAPRLLYDAYDDKVQGATAVSDAFVSLKGSSSNPETLEEMSILGMLLQEGARGAVVGDVAAFFFIRTSS